MKSGLDQTLAEYPRSPLYDFGKARDVMLR